VYYNILIEKGSSIALATRNSITESVKAPSSPVDGDYWLNIGVKPCIPYKRVSGAWVETQYVKLGEVKKAGTTLGTPVSYAFNGVYNSPVYATLTRGTVISASHNIGNIPVIAKARIRCVNAEFGYNINNEIEFWLNGANSDTSSGNIGLTNSANASVSKNRLTMSVLPGSNAGLTPGMVATNATTGARCTLTAASWNMYFTAERGF